MTQKNWKQELQDIERLKNGYLIENGSLNKELDALLNVTDEVVALLYSRRALEVIVSEICLDKLCRDRGSEPLLSIIDRLIRDKVIPEFIHSAMHNLNRNAIYGAHPKDFDHRQVRTAIIDLITILEWYFKEKKYKNSDKPVTPEKPLIDEKLEPIKIEVKKESKKNKIFQKSIVIAIVIVVIGIITMFLYKTTSNSNNPQMLVIDSVKTIQKANDISSKTVKPSKPDTTIKMTYSNNAEKSVKSPIGMGSTKPVKPIVSNNITVPTVNQSEKPIPNTDKSDKIDIENLFTKLTDKQLSFTERKNISLQLKNAFAPNALIAIMIDNKILEKKGFDSYINRLLTLPGLKVTIIRKETNPMDKITLMEVTENR